MNLGLTLGLGSRPLSPPPGYAFVTTTDSAGTRTILTTTNASGDRVLVVTRAS